MCNFIDKYNSVPIPHSGTGYKVFTKIGEQYCQFNRVKAPYKINKDGWIIWDNAYPSYLHGDTGDGFCFSITRKDARKFKKYWENEGTYYNKFFIKKIKYCNGLCKQIDGYSNTMHGLCKEFKILEVIDIIQDSISFLKMKVLIFQLMKEERFTLKI